MAEAEAMQMRTLGESDAARVRMMGEAQADKVARVRIAEAVAIEEQVRAYGGPRYQVTQNVMKNFTDAIATAKVGGAGDGALGESSKLASPGLRDERMRDGALHAPRRSEDSCRSPRECSLSAPRA